MMNAAVYHTIGGPIRVERIPLPSCPKDGVVIRVMATGVCRSDWHGWKGHDSDILNHGLPFVPGHECAGKVVQVGSQVTIFKIGDRVAVPFILSCGDCRYCSSDRATVCLDQRQPGFTQYGSFAEYLALPRAERNLAIMPAGVSWQQAAALGCRFTTAYRAVCEQGRLQQNDSIVVFGCGGLGLSCIMLAVARGCRQIVAVDVSEGALHKASELGATHTVMADTTTDGSQLVRRTVLEMTNGGADLSVEASGFASACENAVWCTRRAGRMVQVGLVSEGQNPALIPMDLVAGREIEIVGSHGFCPSSLPTLLDMVSHRRLDPGVLIEQEVSLEEGAYAIEAMDTGSPLGITMVTRFQNRTTSRL